jgi:hypothetical protein
LIIASSVRLILTSEAIDDYLRISLWQAGRRKTSVLLGFIQAYPLPFPSTTKPINEQATWLALQPSNFSEDFAIEQLHQLLDCFDKILQKPADQDIVAQVLIAIGKVFIEFRPDQIPYPDWESIVQRLPTTPAEENNTDHTNKLFRQLQLLSCVDEILVQDFFAHSTAVGSLMRKQLAPILNPIGEVIRDSTKLMELIKK